VLRHPGMTRPRDIEDRSFRFACAIVWLCERLFERGPGPRRVAYQLLDAGTSVGANLEEAVAGQSRRDFAAKIGIALKEARETRFWLRLVAACYDDLQPSVAPLAAEATELVAILSAISRNARDQA